MGWIEVLDGVDAGAAARATLASVAAAAATDPATGLRTWSGLRARLERGRTDTPVAGAVVHVEAPVGPAAPDAERALRELGRELRARLPRGSEVARLDDRELLAVVPAADAAGCDPVEEVRRAAVVTAPTTGIPAAAVACAPLVPTTVGGLLAQVHRVQGGLLLGGRRGAGPDAGEGQGPDDAPQDDAAGAARIAAALDAGEFDLHYQPVVGRSGEMVAVEALLRWRRPGGLLLPGRFLPLVERSGMEVEVGSWVLHRALADAADWARRGLGGLPVVVNVTPGQLASERLAEEVAVALARSGGPGLVVEAPLRADELDLRRLLDRLADLRTAGARLSLDRVDRGAVSAGLLPVLPLVDTVKLDRSVVADLAGHGRATAAALRILAERSGTHLGATGVETDAELGELRGLGVEVLQGYRFCPPVEGDRIVAGNLAFRPAA
ncbi:MAG: EAL domain-containing protein [Microthrixaceae bacterium]